MHGCVIEDPLGCPRVGKGRVLDQDMDIKPHFLGLGQSTYFLGADQPPINGLIDH